MTTQYDLVIRGGLVVDGTGGEPFVGDVGVRGDRISAVGRFDGHGVEEIEAADRIVTPGFVDIHTHYDGQITWEHRLTPSSEHGVTTVVMGNCGVGFAPARADRRSLMIKLMEGVEDIPEVVMAEGVPWNWESFPDYLDALEGRPADIDFAAQLPHSPLRVHVMGQRGVDLEPPTEEDLREMRRLTAEALEAGAIGVSTSRSLNHRFRDGRVAPSVGSEEAELLALAAGMRDVGKGVFQLQSNRALPAHDEFAMMRRIAEQSGRPLSFTLIPDPDGDWRDYVAGLRQAAADNLPIRGQFLPRPPGVLMGLDLSLHMFSMMPSYREIADLPLDQKVRAMRDPAMRSRLMTEEPFDPQPHLVAITQKTHPLFALGDPPNYIPAIEDSIRFRAAAAGVDEREFIYDELLKDEGRAILYWPSGNYERENFALAAELFDEPNTVLGLGDGGAHYGIVCDGPYPTFFLKKWVMDASAPYRLPIERAVNMLTCQTARTVGLNDRGVLAPGYKADINVIALDRLQLHAPRMIGNLPANGRRLVQKSDGYDATIVSGQVTYRSGTATGVLPGGLVRGARPAPDPRS